MLIADILLGRELRDVLIPELGNLTATAILGWYAWYTASRTIPGLVTDFREEMAVEREANRNELASERKQRHQDHLVMVQVLQDLASRLPPPKEWYQKPKPPETDPKGTR